MTRMAEQDLKDTFKKSEFKQYIATVLSTATIVLTFVYGYKELVADLRQDIIIDARADTRDIMIEQQKVQFKRDAEQDDTQSKKDAEQDFKINSVIEKIK